MFTRYTVPHAMKSDNGSYVRLSDVEPILQEALEREQRLRYAITVCLQKANGRQVEWGERAVACFEILENATASP